MGKNNCFLTKIFGGGKQYIFIVSQWERAEITFIFYRSCIKHGLNVIFRKKSICALQKKNTTRRRRPVEQRTSSLRVTRSARFAIDDGDCGQTND